MDEQKKDLNVHDENCCQCSGHSHEHHHDEHEHSGHEEHGCCHHHESHNEHDDCCHHEHGHEHGHEHCHEHSHSHGECCCGHSHEHSEKPNYTVYAVSLVLFALSFALPKFAFIPQIAAVLICGFSIFKTGVVSLFRLRFDETTLILIAAAAAICMGDYSEAYLITLLFSIGELIEDYAVDKSQSKVENLINLTDDVAYNELGEKIDADEIKCGDVFLVKPGDKVCVDAQIIKGQSSFDTSNLTGESIPADCKADDTILSGYINISSSVVCRATTDYSNSTAAKIKEYVEQAAGKKASTEKFITKFAKIYTPVIIIIAVLMAIAMPVFGITGFADALKRALTFMIASCPCALVISIPLSYFSAIGAASKNGVLIKGSKFINTLAKADSIAFDKTGTLTKGVLKVKEVITNGNISEDELLSYVCAVEKHSSHPMAKAICDYYKGDVPEAEDVKEIFGKGIEGTVNGKRIIAGNKKLLEDNVIQGDIKTDAHIYVCEDSVLLGAVVLADEIRSDASEAVKMLNSLGVKDVYMLSGDNNTAVSSVCSQIGGIQGFGSLLPTEKTQKVKEIKQGHKSVVYVGDGVNDAPSLAAADFGISIGSSNALALESGDATLLYTKLTAIPNIISLAKYTMRVIYSNITFALLIKLAVLIAATLGYAPIWLALFADVGVLIITVLHSVTILYRKCK